MLGRMIGSFAAASLTPQPKPPIKPHPPYDKSLSAMALVSTGLIVVSFACIPLDHMPLLTFVLAPVLVSVAILVTHFTQKAIWEEQARRQSESAAEARPARQHQYVRPELPPRRTRTESPLAAMRADLPASPVPAGPPDEHVALSLSLFKMGCPDCHARAGQPCRPIRDVLMVVVDRARNWVCHIPRMQLAVDNNIVDREQLRAQFTGNPPEGLEL